MAAVSGGTVIWDLEVNAKKLSQGLVDARDQVGKVAKDIDSSIKSTTNGIVDSFKRAESSSKAFAFGLAGIGTALAGTAGFVLKNVSDMEMLRSSFDTLTGSTEKGAKMYKDLYDFASKTPFETGDLAKASQTMLSFGIRSEDVMDNVRILGDISLGNAEKLSGLSLAFSQVSSTGRLMGQDLLQMINSGFNPLTIISQKTGKSMADLKKDMENGAISADMVRDAMKTATSEGGLFFKGMERGGQTLSGLFSTLKDTVGGTLRNLFGLSDEGAIIEGGFADKIKDAITDLISFLNDNQDKIIKFFETSFGWIQDNLPAIIGLIIGGLVPAIGAIGVAIATNPLTGFLVAGALLGVLIDTLVKQMGGWDVVIQGLKNTFQGLTDAFVTYILPSLKNLFTVITTQLLPSLQKLWEVISPVLIPVLKILATLVAGVVILALKGFIDWLANTISTIARVGNQIAELINWFKEIPNRISAALGGVRGAILRPFEDAFNAVSSIFNKIKEKMNQINPFHRNSPSLVDNVKAGVGIITDQFKSLGAINFPSISRELNVEPNRFQTFGIGGDENSSGGMNQQEIVVNIGEVNDMQDIDAIAREIGFRVSLLPAS